MLLLLMRGECFCQVFLVQERSDYLFFLFSGIGFRWFFTRMAASNVVFSYSFRVRTIAQLAPWLNLSSSTPSCENSHYYAKEHFHYHHSFFDFLFSIPLGLPTLTGVGWLVEQPREEENAWVWNATTGFWVELLLFFALGSSFRWRIWW